MSVPGVYRELNCAVCMREGNDPIFSAPYDSIGVELMKAHLKDVHNEIVREM